MIRIKASILLFLKYNSSILSIVKTLLLLITLNLYASPSSNKLPVNNFSITYHPKATQLGGKALIPTIGKTVSVDGFLETYNDGSVFLTMEGIFKFSQNTEKRFYFKTTFAHAKLFINDQEIINIKSSYEQTNYTFSPGTYKIKILVFNTDEPSANVRIGMIDTQEQPLSDNEISKQLEPIIKNKDVALNYLFALEPKTIKLKDSTKESILFLNSSYSPAYYTIINAKKAKLKAIIYSGYNALFDCANDIKILRATKIPAASKSSPNINECNSMSSGFMCPDEKDFLELNEWIKEVSARSLSGFTNSSMFNKEAVIPEIILDVQAYKNIDEIQNKIKVQREHLKHAASDPFYNSEQKSWMEILKIKNDVIPKNKFRAYYMDKNDATKIQYSEVVDNLSLTYSRDPFHTILADNFVGLWVGDFEFKEDETYSLNVSLSWAKAKITDNGEVIYNGSDSAQTEHVFTKGIHRITVEYINNYGQVDVSVNLVKPVEVLNYQKTQPLFSKETKVYLFGGYESERSDHSVDIFMKNSDAPSILFLASYETINYKIHNANNAHLKAVIYNAYEPIGKIDVDKNVKVFQDKRLEYADRLIPYSYKPHFNHIENKWAFQGIINYIEALSGKKPEGFSSTYAPSLSDKRLERLDKDKMIVIPQLLLDDDMYAKIQEKMESLDKE
jgi:hypothetical protein